MQFEDLKYDSFDDIEYSYLNEPCTVWQATEIDVLMTKPTMLSDFEYRVIRSQLEHTLTYGDAQELISKLKENQR